MIITCIIVQRALSFHFILLVIRPIASRDIAALRDERIKVARHKGEAPGFSLK